jgi:hypothetical protein
MEADSNSNTIPERVSNLQRSLPPIAGHYQHHKHQDTSQIPRALHGKWPPFHQGWENSPYRYSPNSLLAQKDDPTRLKTGSKMPEETIVILYRWFVVDPLVLTFDRSVSLSSLCRVVAAFFVCGF